MHRNTTPVCLIVLAGLLLTALPMSAADATTDIERALNEKYPSSNLTRDHTNLIETGSPLILKVDNLRTSNTLPALASSTYKNGKFHLKMMLRPSFNGPDGKPEVTRTFVAGERLWVTKINVQSHEVSLDVCSDDVYGVRYRARIKFPFDSDADMTTAKAIAKVAEVFDFAQ